MGALLVLVIAYVALPLTALTLMLVLVRKTSALSERMQGLSSPSARTGQPDAAEGESDV